MCFCRDHFSGEHFDEGRNLSKFLRIWFSKRESPPTHFAFFQKTKWNNSWLAQVRKSAQVRDGETREITEREKNIFDMPFPSLFNLLSASLFIYLCISFCCSLFFCFFPSMSLHLYLFLSLSLITLFLSTSQGHVRTRLRELLM